MNMYMDTEFTGLHKNTTLISLALVYEDGRYFYAEFTDYAKDQVDEWLHNNIIQNLKFPEKNVIYNELDNGSIEVKDCSIVIKSILLVWLKSLKDKKIIFWSDCLHYDWVLFCDLFGGALDIPESIYYIPFDICVLFKLAGIDPDIKREKFVEDMAWYKQNIKEKRLLKHNSLWDTQIIKLCYKKLKNEYFPEI